MSREDPQLKIRLPEGLKAKIKKSAENSNRSMNSEIVHILQGYFDEVDHQNEMVEWMKNNEAQPPDVMPDSVRKKMEEAEVAQIKARMESEAQTQMESLHAKINALTDLVIKEYPAKITLTKE